MSRTDTQGFDISGFSAAVIGCGGLGCNIAVHLAGAGIGRLLLCDFDRVSESNLNRQFLYKRTDIGKYKAKAAEKFLKAYTKQTEIESFVRKIESAQDLSFASGCDLLFLAVDNNAAREAAADFCTSESIPLVNGGINGFYGSTYLYVPGKTPCPDCAGLTSLENRSILSVSSTAGIIGAHEAQLGIEFLLGKADDRAGILYLYDNAQTDALKIQSRTGCKRCCNNEVTYYV